MDEDRSVKAGQQQATRLPWPYMDTLEVCHGVWAGPEVVWGTWDVRLAESQTQGSE